MIAIIDYDAGNLKSVEKALKYIGQNAQVTREPEIIRKADKVILPGVGAFKEAMRKLEKYNLVSVIKTVVKEETPFLGICLGQQLMFEYSEENPGIQGLNLIPGEVLKIPEQKGLKIPQIGWNSLTINKNSRLFTGIPQDSYVYFVHSYYCKATNRSDVAATIEYSTTIDASLEHGNLFACQFHPEKSGEVGLTILNNFAAL